MLGLTPIGIVLLGLPPVPLTSSTRPEQAPERYIVGDSVVTIASPVERKAVEADDGSVLVGAVLEAFDIGDPKSVYLRALVNVRRRDGGEPDYLIVYMGHRYSHRADVFKIILAADYSVVGIEHGYEPTADDQRYFARPRHHRACPDETVDFVFAAPDTGLGCSEYVRETAEAVMALNDYNVVFLSESQSTREAYLNWLHCDNLIAFGSMSHGYEEGLVLADGELNASALSGLDAGRARSKLLYWGACEAHNSPFEPAVLRLDPYRFISGDVLTPCPGSEYAQKCFFEEWTEQKEDADPEAILRACERTHDHEGYHGISGTADTPWSLPPVVSLVSVVVSGTSRDETGRVFMDANAVPLVFVPETGWNVQGSAVGSTAQVDLTATDASGNRVDTRVTVEVTTP